MKRHICSFFFLSALLLGTTPMALSNLLQQTQLGDPIKLRAELVILDVQVTIRKQNQPIAGLSKDHFYIYEDGVKQEITHFSQDKLPLSIVLLLDLSGSVQPEIEKIRDGALQAFQRLKPEDEVAIMGFGTRTKLIQDFTTDRRLIVDRIASAKQVRETGMFTLLNEAIYQAALLARRASNPSSRRVIIVVTDDVPTQLPFQGHSEKDALEQLLEPGSVVCGLVLSRKLADVLQKVSLVPFTRRVFSMGSIKNYANKTGGETISLKKEEIETKLVGLIDRLRTRYTIGYTSSNTKLDGKFRRIKVKLSPIIEKQNNKLVVSTRQGYYARRNGNKTAKTKE